MLSFSDIREETNLYLKVIAGKDPEYPDPIRRRWYPSVAFRQRLSAVACTLHCFFSLARTGVHLHPNSIPEAPVHVLFK